MVWYGPTSETIWMQRMQKIWLKYINFTELKKITTRIYSNFRILFFQVLQILPLFFLFDSNKNFLLALQVCCLWYFLKERQRVGFIVFLSGLKK